MVSEMVVVVACHDIEGNPSVHLIEIVLNGGTCLVGDDGFHYIGVSLSGIGAVSVFQSGEGDRRGIMDTLFLSKRLDRRVW